MDGVEVTPLHEQFGVSVTGLDLKSVTDVRTVSYLGELVAKHRVVVFRNQGVLTAEQQIAITGWFGEIEWAGFEQHPKSPHRYILRVSNVEEEGYREFGTSGFHIDGSFMPNPNAYSLYHIVQVPSKGNTLFVPLNEVYEGLSQDRKSKWQRLWILKTFKRVRGFRDEPGHITHPLVYNHPLTAKNTLCFHLGKTSAFIWDRYSPQERKSTKEETNEILKELEEEINRDNCRLQYSHQWEAGDLIITDNLAVGHHATPETQLSPQEVGLRIMHRTIVKGYVRPCKS